MVFKKVIALSIAGMLFFTATIALAKILAPVNDVPFSATTQDRSNVNTDEIYGEELPPAIYNSENVTLVPLQTVINSLGGNLTENTDNTMTIKCNKTIVNLSYKHFEGTIDGYPIQIDFIPEIHNDVTYVPLQFVVNNFLAMISIDESNRIISVSRHTFDKPIFNVKPLTRHDTNVSFYAEIPVITRLNDKIYEKNLNQNMTNIISEKANVFFDDSSVLSSRENLSYSINSRMTFDDSRLISLTFTEKIINLLETEYYHRSAQVIDLSLQKEINLSNLFKVDNYREILLNEIMDDESHNYNVYLDDTNENNFYIRDGFLVLLCRPADNQTSQNELLEFNISFKKISQYLRNEYAWLAS